MFVSYYTLTQAAAELGIDTRLVKDVQDHGTYGSAKLSFGGITTEVYHNNNDESKVSAVIKTTIDYTFRIETDYIKADEYHILASIIDTVTNEKMYSCPWVAYDVKSKLPADVVVSELYLKNKYTAVFVFRFKDEKQSLYLQLVSVDENRPYRYNYAIFNEENSLELAITNGDDLSKVS